MSRPMVLRTGIIAATAFCLIAGCASKKQTEALTGDGLQPGSVPEPYASLILEAVNRCDAVTAPLLAAQLQQESGFQTGLTSSAGAQGPAQFLPATWAAYGVDGDHDGDTDINDPADAVHSQANYMCDLAAQITAWKQQGVVTGDLTELMLAAYNAGPGAVAAAGGIPPYSETIDYVDTITAAMSDFAASTVAAGPIQLPLQRQWWDADETESYGVNDAIHSSWHTGEDYACPTGAPVYAVHNGTVRTDAAQESWAGPNFLTVTTGPGRLTTWYAHMSATSVDDGQRVRAGQRIGSCGDEGNSYGAHLHLEVHLRGGPIYGEDTTNPNTWFEQQGIS